MSDAFVNDCNRWHGNDDIFDVTDFLGVGEGVRDPVTELRDGKSDTETREIEAFGEADWRADCVSRCSLASSRAGLRPHSERFVPAVADRNAR